MEATETVIARNEDFVAISNSEEARDYALNIRPAQQTAISLRIYPGGRYSGIAFPSMSWDYTATEPSSSEPPMPTALLIRVVAPCSGAQVVSLTSPNVYQGVGGDFTLVILSKPPSSSWLLDVYNYSGVSGCSVYTRFAQASANADPIGGYHPIDGSGNPDPSLGEANVSI